MMSSPNSEPDGKKEPDGKMDPADFIQLRQFITFPRSNTTWSISSRRSCYPKDGEIASNSFVEPALFNVVIGGIGHKSMPSGIPRTAILKVQSLSVSTPPLSSLCGPCQFLMDECVQSLKDRIHTITKHNKDKTFDRKSLITSSTREEFVAMNQLTLNECSSTPRLVDHKVVLHDEMPGKEIYVSFILMTECPGLPLKQEIFWRLPQAERDLVRKAFRRALSEIHACWIVLEQYESKDLIWNARENKVYFTKLAPSTTYGLTTHLPSRYLHKWHNIWFDLWDLTTKTFVDPVDRVANPKDVSTKDKDDGSDIAAWDIAYPAAGGGMPVCEEEGEELVERCVGRKVVEVGELVSEKRGRGFLWRIRRGLGRA